MTCLVFDRPSAHPQLAEKVKLCVLQLFIVNIGRTCFDENFSIGKRGNTLKSVPYANEFGTGKA